MPAPRLCLCAVCGGSASDCYPALAGGGTFCAHWLHVWRLTMCVWSRRVVFCDHDVRVCLIAVVWLWRACKQGTSLALRE